MSEYEDSVSEHAADDAHEDAAEASYKLVELRSDGTGVVQLDDGRMFTVEIKEGAAVRKGSKVTLDHEGEDKDGVPSAAVVTGLA